MIGRLPHTYLCCCCCCCYTHTSHTPLLTDGEAEAAGNGDARDSVISINNLYGGLII